MKAWITNHAYKQLTGSGKASCKVQLHLHDDDVARVEIEIPDPQPTLKEAAQAVVESYGDVGWHGKVDDLKDALEREAK